MKLTKDNLANYLITLQFIEAGYPMTFDEVLEMNEVRYYLIKKKFYTEYTMTIEQNKKWFVEASKIVSKTLKVSITKAESLVGDLDFCIGLKIKN